MISKKNNFYENCSYLTLFWISPLSILYNNWIKSANRSILVESENILNFAYCIIRVNYINLSKGLCFIFIIS